MLIEITRRFDISAHLDNDGHPVTWVKDVVTGTRAVLTPYGFADFAAEPTVELAVANIAEHAFAARITRHHNGECCCGSCDPDFCYDCSHFSAFCRCAPRVSLWKAPRPVVREETIFPGEPPF